jgi:hypothetical protein
MYPDLSDLENIVICRYFVSHCLYFGPRIANKTQGDWSHMNKPEVKV